MTPEQLHELYKGWDVTALCIWREARGEGNMGMLAVGNVIANTAKARRITCDEEVLRPLRYSSMTYANDPQLKLFPKDGDIAWEMARFIAKQAKDGTINDITHGANLYYSDSMKTPPYWATNGKAQKVAVIGHHIFYRE